MGTRSSSGRAARLLCLAMMLAIPGRAEAGRVQGTVVDRDGKPAAGAKVWIAGRGVPTEVREASADDSGAFAIDAAPGDWFLFALRGAEGGRGGLQAIPGAEDGEGGKDPAPAKITLGPPTTLRGRLRDAETGRPIPGGRFALDDARRPDVDARGRFEVAGLAMTHHEAYPLCPGYERKRILFDTTGRADAELELSLPRGGKVVGRVVGADGKPVAGAIVGLRASGSTFSIAALWERCAEDGRFVYDGKALDRNNRLAARAPGFLDDERTDVLVIDPSKPAEIDFTLRPDPIKVLAVKPAPAPAGRRAVSGTVLGPDAKPVASAVVRWGLLASSDPVPETRTDAAGGFRLVGMPAALNVLTVMAEGLAPSFPPVDAGGDRQLVVRLGRGAEIRGRVVDDAGRPIEGARVSPRITSPLPNGGHVYLDVLAVRTDRDGRFLLRGMPEGVTCDVLAAEKSAVRLRPLSASDESVNVVTLLGAGALRGRVVDPAGNPVRNFRIRVSLPRGFKPGDPAGGYFAGYDWVGLSFTRADGEFTITGLTAGNLHRLTVFAGMLGTGEADRAESQSIDRLKPAEDLTIRLGPPHVLRVRVFGEDGKPVEGARVTAIENEGRATFRWDYPARSEDDRVTARSDADGWAEFPGLAFGKGTVTVRAEGFTRRALDWTKGEEEFEVDVEPEARLSGTVLDEAGEPVAGARLILSWGAGERMIVPVGAKDGRYLVDGLGPGQYTLAVIAATGPGLNAGAIELEAGKTLIHDIRVDAPTPGAAGGKK